MASSSDTLAHAALVRGGRGSLPRRQRLASWIAGVLGLLLIELGFLAMIAVVVVAWVLVVVAGVRGYGSVAYDPRLGPAAALEVGWQAIVAAPEVLGVWFWVFGAGGAVVVVLGVAVSALILRAGRVRRPWRVAWSAAGVSVFTVSIVYLALSYLSNVGTKLLPGGNWPAFRVYLVLALVVVAIVTVVVGAGSWWWMAHLLRDRRPRSVTSPTSARSRTAPR